MDASPNVCEKAFLSLFQMHSDKGDNDLNRLIKSLQSNGNFLENAEFRLIISQSSSPCMFFSRDDWE